MVINILIAIILFGVIIAVHEFGHFIVAKLSDIKVNKFAIGMGPKIFKFTKGETEYSLRLLPIGGFCAMEGEDTGSEDNRAFFKKPIKNRFAVLVAGATMNLILGLIIVIISTSITENMGSNIISDFRENAKSQQTGLQKGDEIISINGMRILTENDIAYKLQNTDDKTYDVVVKRNGEKINLNDVEFYYSFYYYIDEEKNSYVTFKDKSEYNGDKELSLAEYKIDFTINITEKSFLSVMNYSVRDSLSKGRMIWISLIDLIRGKYGINDLSGPVGIVGVIGETAAIGMDQLLSLMAFISINVGIFNLLPLPALDGGKVVFLLIEFIRGKRIPPEKEGIVHFIGLALLMLLMVVISFNDIQKLIS